MTHNLAEGDTAPNFTLPATGGKALSLNALRGKRVVLFFYPKDDTSACTKEALAFSSSARKFGARKAVVIGISRDTLASHERFAAKHDLKLRLASDEDGAVCDAYGVWREKKLYGRVYMGIERSTFLISEDGMILKAWRGVRVNGHVDEVLALLD